MVITVAIMIVWLVQILAKLASILQIVVLHAKLDISSIHLHAKFVQVDVFNVLIKQVFV